MSGHQSEQTHDRAKNTGVLSRAMHLPLCSGGPNGNSAPSHSTPGHSAPGHSAPSHSAPSQSTPSDSTPSDSAPSDSAPSQSTPSQSTPSDSAPSDSAPSQSTPSDSAPSQSTHSDSTPSDSTLSDSTPSQSTHRDSTPSHSAPSDSAPSHSAPSDSTPSNSTLSDSTPSQSTHRDSTPSDSAPSDSAPSDSAPSHSAPSDSAPSQSTPSDSAPSQSTHSDSTPSDSTLSDSTPSQSTHRDSALSDSAPCDSALSHSPPCNRAPRDSTPRDSTPSHSAPSHSAPSQSTPSHSAPSHSPPCNRAPRDSAPSHSESPDSMRSISSLSSRSTDSTLEAESRQLCLNQGNINAAQRGNTLTNELFSSGHFHSQPRDGDVDRSSVESVPNGKSFSAYLDPNTGSRSDNLAFLMTGSQQYGGDQGDCSLEDSGRSTGMSPDSALREGPVGSAEPTHRSSCKNELVSLASVSSDEREMRSNHSGLNGSDSNKREQQVYSRGPTPAEGRTFLAPVSGQPDISSMEPQLGSGNQTFCDPSSTVPPLHDDVGCVENCPDRNLREQQVSNTPGGMRKSTSASRKTEIKRFPKPDFKNVRSKIMSRPANPSRASNSADVKSKPSRSVQSGEKRPIFTHKKVFQREEEGRNRSKPETPSNRNKANVAKSQSGRLDRSSTLRTQPGSSTVRTQPGSSTLRTQPGSSTLRTQPGSSTLSTKSNKDTQVSSQEDLLVKRTPSGPPSSLPCKGAVNNNMSPPEDRIETEAARRESKNGKTASRSKELLMGKGSRVESCAENREVEVRTAAASERSKTRLGQRPPPGSGRGSSPAQAPAANLRLPPPVSKAKLGTSSKYGRTAGNMSPQRIRQISTAGNPRMRLTERAPATVAERSKRPPHPGPTAMRPTATSRLPVKSQDPLRSPSCPSLASVCSEPCATTRAAPGTNVTRSRPNDKPGPPHAAGGVGRAPSTKLGGVRPHVPSHQGRGTPAAPAPGCKAAALTGSKTVAGPLLRAGSAGFQYQAVAPAVDKNKPRVSPRGQPPPVSGQPDLLPPDAKPLGVDHYRAQNPQKSDYIQQLKNLLNFSNRRFEAVAVVIQRVFQQREEALKRSEELSHELVTLQGELVSSATLNERLGREKDELRVAFEGVLQKVQDQHQCDLADLEERLRTFYSAEWEKVHEAYQEEADKYKKQVQQQVEELRSKHEALRRDLEASHAQKMESVKLQYETSFEELRKVHEQDMLALDKTLKESETTLSEQIRELTKENDALSEKLKEEANRRKMLAEKNQKDSHTLYLEQELDSLKVVLDIKTEQLHQQGKKLIQMDKLMERNVQLDECLQKVQQENEELKARMDKHAALSRQLSTEQAVLQESLQKESKVNKRLSMENEELLWKLHNGDLGSPRKLSPSSPSVSLQSPRNSALFSSGLGSPR